MKLFDSWLTLAGLRRVFSGLGFVRRDVGCCLVFFFLGLGLRAVPELLVSGYPVGYETIAWYAAPLLSFKGQGLIDVFVGFFRAGPLFFMLAWFVVNVTGAHAFLVLKVFGPVLYGVLAAVFFVFVRRGLQFDWKWASVAALLLVFQVAALRESWDRFRTVFGLVFLFAGLTALKSEGSGRGKWVLLAVFGVLTVLSRDYVAVVLFVSVLGFVLLEKKGGGELVRPILALVPAFAVFGVMVFPVLPAYWGAVVEMEFASRSYVWVLQNAFVIFVVCYVLILPFVVLGLRLRRDWLVASMLVWLFVASASVVFGPLFSVPGYQRWLMLLVFPFCVYAVWGFERLGLFSGRRVWALVSVLLVFVVVGSGYSTGLFSYVGWVPNDYVPVNLVGSTIGWDQVDDVKAVLSWLDRNAVSDSSVLAEECFYGWTLLYFGRADRDVRVIPYGANASPVSALEMALRDGFSRVYLIWFSDQTVRGFQIVYSWNSVSVFQYTQI